MIHYLFDLLVTKPEQEKVLLALIINKLVSGAFVVCVTQSNAAWSFREIPRRGYPVK